MEARSLAAAIFGSSEVGRGCVFAEHACDKLLTATEYMTMVRRGAHKLIHFIEGEGQLFDLAADPGERRNLWDAPDLAALRDELIAEILAWRLSSGLTAQRFLRAEVGRRHDDLRSTFQKAGDSQRSEAT